MEDGNQTGGVANAFKPGVQEVEFKVRVGFTHLKSIDHISSNRREKEWQSQNCKIVCKQGQWIGPLCRGSHGNKLPDIYRYYNPWIFKLYTLDFLLIW